MEKLLQKFEQVDYDTLVEVASGAAGRLEPYYRKNQGDTAWQEIIKCQITN